MLRLRLERERLGLSLAALCQRTGIEPSNLSRIERGLIPAYPGWRTRIARALNWPEEQIDELFEVVSNERDRA